MDNNNNDASEDELTLPGGRPLLAAASSPELVGIASAFAAALPQHGAGWVCAPLASEAARRRTELRPWQLGRLSLALSRLGEPLAADAEARPSRDPRCSRGAAEVQPRCSRDAA